jgi:hypothetical protein
MIAIPGGSVLDPSAMSPQNAAVMLPRADASPLRLEVRTLEQAEIGGWNTMVNEHPMGSVFQHTAYIRVLKATFKHIEPYFVSLVDSRGMIKGGLSICFVKSWLTHGRLVALPCGFYSDPMVRSKVEMKTVFDGIVRLFRRTRARYVEIKARRSVPVLIEADKMTPVYFHKTHILDLSDGLDAVSRSLDRAGVMQELRQAEASGITMRPAESEADIRTFYDLLTVNERWRGVPPQRWEYFRNIWSRLVPLKVADFTMAQKNGRTIGALCSFWFKDTVHLAYLGTWEPFQPEGVGQALWWNVIQKAAREGFRYVDMGKTSPRDEDLGARQTRWNAVEQEVPSFYYPCPTLSAMGYDEAGQSRPLARKAWKIMPTSLARLAAHAACRYVE